MEYFPTSERIPELPIREDNFLRPMSPYAVSKLHGEYLMRNYHSSYGLKTIVSKGFNTEGAGRGIMFVTSAIACQVMKPKFGESDKIVAGNVNAFRDWGHIADIVRVTAFWPKKASRAKFIIKAQCELTLS
jgi:GDPmannose 4,6-dehydratase